MNPITRLALKVLNSENFQPVNLLDIRLAGASAASTIRLVSPGDIGETTWGGNTYLPFNFSRSEFTEVLSVESGDSHAITINAANVDGQLGQLLSRVELEAAKATLHVMDRRILLKYPDRTRDYIRRFGGEIRNVSVTESIIAFQIVGIMGILDPIQLPRRLFQPTCPYTFGSIACGAIISESPNTIDATVLSGSTVDSIRVSDDVNVEAGEPEDPSDFWRNGYVIFKDGLNACQARPIHRVYFGGGERRFYVSYPFLTKPAPGDQILIRRGCSKTKRDCELRPKRSGNAMDKFGGFEELPFGEVRPTKPIRGYS